MQGRSHRAIGAAVGIAAAHATHAATTFAGALGELRLGGAPLPHGVDVVGGAALAYGVGLTVGALAGLAPDLDHPNSTLGGLLPAWWHALTPGHRGFTHTALGAAIFSLVWYLACFAIAGGHPAVLAPLVFLAGYLSHLAADAVTDHGIPLFAPLSHFAVRLPLTIRTGGPAEPVVAYGCVLLLLAWTVGLGHWLPAVALARWA